MTIIPFTLNTRRLELDQERKTLALSDGDACIELPRAEVAQMVSFLLAHPAFFEDRPASPPCPIPVVPSMASLLEDGIFTADTSTRLLMGVHVSTGEPYWSTWQDFRSGGAFGRGRSGATNTLAFLIAQALLGGVEVWVADPHFNKSTGLTALLRPLAHRVRLAGTTDDVEKMIHDWDEEMDRRKAESGPYKPLVVVFDEWNTLLEHFDREAEEAGEKGSFSMAVAASAIRCAREMCGYEMFVLLGVNSFADKEISGEALRCLLHTVLCHRMTSDHSRLVLSDKKWGRQTEGLRTGSFILRDNEMLYSLLTAPLVEVSDMRTIERLLREAE